MEIRLGESIRRLRKESGFTQEQLAEALGVTTGAVYKWESGKATPELEMLVDIAEFFETSVDALLTLDEALLKRYDCILALKSGNITESGSFGELMEKKGYFYSLYTVSQ